LRVKIFNAGFLTAGRNKKNRGMEGKKTVKGRYFRPIHSSLFSLSFPFGNIHSGIPATAITGFRKS